MNPSENVISQYILNKKKQRIGVVVAKRLKSENKPCQFIGIGWSKVNMGAGDVFDRERALEIAINRADCGWGCNTTVPFSFEEHLVKMEDRAIRYFKEPKENVVSYK